MELLINHILQAFILPPGLFISLILLGALLRLRFYRTGQSLIYGSLGLLFLMSLPVVSQPLLHLYENVPATDIAALKHSKARAIVILGGGRYYDAPEYGGDTVSIFSLERIRYGAWLQRRIKLPILVTGGLVLEKNRPPEAQLMKQVLTRDFLARVNWVEKDSRNTYENAVNSRVILDKEGIDNIILVTHALHMPRALTAFRKVGFTVTPAPMGFDTSEPLKALDFLPNMDSLLRMHDLMHEIIGRLWYRWRYY